MKKFKEFSLRFLFNLSKENVFISVFFEANDFFIYVLFVYSY